MLTMQPNDLAKLLNVSGHTLRRWCNEFAPYLSPGAAPPKGNARALNEHDQRVLALVAGLRASGYEHDVIVQRLDAERKNNWQGLPELPAEFLQEPVASVSIEQAAARAHELAQVAALQTQVQFLEQRNQELAVALVSAQDRVKELEQTLNRLYEESAGTERSLNERVSSLGLEKHQIEVQLLEARAEVARLEGELKSYGLGRNAPVNVVLIVAGAVIFGIVLVAAILILVHLVS
jgi:DNA-binding transcriptional MerR regulator